MSEDYGISDDGGFHLVHMVQAQRGMSDREIEIFLATGRKPDLSQPPPEELERIDGDTQIMPLDDAAAWLSGGTLTAASFFDFDSSHSVSPLYEVVRPKVEAFRFDPHQPRADDGRWSDGGWSDGGSLLTKPRNVDEFAKRLRKASTGRRALSAAKSNADWRKKDPLKDQCAEFYQRAGDSVNGPLRRGETLPPKPRVVVRELDVMMAESPLKRDVQVMRGIGDPTHIFGDAWNNYGDNAGLEWEDDAFVSGTTDDETAKYFATARPGYTPTVMRMLVPKGTPALHLESAQFTQWELLLGRGYRYRIVEDSGHNTRPRELSVEVIAPNAQAITAATEAADDEDDVSEDTTRANDDVSRFIDDGDPVRIITAPDRDDDDVTSAAFRFDKNQPRDDDGKWTDGFPGVNLPDITSKPSGTKTGGSTKKVTPAVIYKKHDDGAVIGHSASGQRMRWDAGRKKFIVEKQKNDSWVEESAHTKTSAYNEFKNPDKWFEPAETGPKNEPSSPSLTPEPDLADTDTTAETPDLPPVVQEPEKPEIPQAPEKPEIPQQPEAPEIESTPTTPYVGPTATNYEGAPKAATDALRQAYTAEIAHERRIDARAAELRKDHPDKYTGWDAFTQAQKDARAELAGDAPPDQPLANALEELGSALPEYKSYEKVRRRLNYEASLEVSFSTFAKEHGLGELTPEVKADLAKRTKDAFAGKKVAVRVSAKTVEHILSTGRIKSQFETNKSSGKKDIDMRASVETTLFDIDDRPWQNAEKRPIYGYVALDGIRPVGIGSAELGNPSTDQLTQYGNVQVVLKDSVRSRTTAMFGDSLNEMREGTPSPIDDPDYKSFTAGRGALTSKSLDGLDRSGETAHFRSNSYAEAQIHGGVGVDDIEEIVFSSNPTATVKQQLDDAGISYRVLTFKTAADGSDEERANALRIAEQDKPLIEGEIAKLQAKLADPKYAGDEFYKKDLAKYEKQLKTINDALPALRGEKKSAKSKVAAAKEKVEKATAPKQAEAPKIESAPSAKLSAAEEQELSSLQADIADLYAQSGYWRMLAAEVTHKQGTGKLLSPQDIKDSTQADGELKKLRDAATPLADRALELRMKRDGDLFGSVDDANAERWASKAKPSAVMLPSNDKAKIDKIADSYRVNDKQTTEHNMSLRSDDPAQAALAWRSRMKRMINSQKMTHDAVVYRGAALTPERVMQLRPGAVMIDPGSMSTDESRGTAEFYMNVRRNDLPGTLPTVFEIRAPKGIPVADVDYGEYVFDFETPMRIISTTRGENGLINVVAELVPPDEAKALYGAAKPAKPKAANAPTVNLNAGKKGGVIKAKDAKRIFDINFDKNGILPDSSPQAIYDKAKSTAYFNDWSIMQVLEAIDAMRPGYKKTVLDWVKTPAGSAYVGSKTPTS